MTSLQLANCSMFVPRRRETLGRRQWTVALTGLPMPKSTMTAGVVDRESYGDRLKGVGQVGRSESTDVSAPPFQTPPRRSRRLDEAAGTGRL